MASLRQDPPNSRPRSSQTAQTDAAAGVRYSRLHPQHGSDDPVSGHSENDEEPGAQEGDAVHATNDHPQAHASGDRQNIEKLHSMHKAYDRLASDYWTYELMGILVCLATLVSIFAVLFVYHNGPTPHFVRGISLNTVISILATVSRAAVVFVAASVIAQQKWLRFEPKSRSLYEVLLYDDATRGPLGSLYLLGSLRLGITALLAVAVAVLSLGFEPFVQQSVKYPLRDLPISSTSPLLPTVRNANFATSPVSNLTVNFNAVITQALYADSVLRLQPACAGTSCAWPEYTSVAFCASCEDAMHDITIEPEYDPALRAFTGNDYLSTFSTTDIDLGSMWGGTSLGKSKNTPYTVSLGQGYPTTFQLNTTVQVEISDSSNASTLSYPETLVWNLHAHDGMGYQLGTSEENGVYFIYTNNTINGIKGPLKAFGHVNLAPAADGSRLVATSAQRCAISFCAQQYASTFRNGTLSARVTDTNYGIYHPSLGIRDTSYLYWRAHVNGSLYQGGFQNQSEVVGNMILVDVYAPLTNLEGSVIRWRNTGYAPEYNTGLYNAAPDVMQFMSNVENNTAKIAQGLSNFIQQHGDSHAVGQAYLATPFVEVRWAWLTFPLALIVIVLVALISTMYQTHHRRMPIWKSSPFPLLYNYRTCDVCRTNKDATGQTMMAPATTTSRHEELAKETHLRLRPEAGSWSFEEKL